MGRNVFFSQEVKSEQNLYEDLIIESLKIYGQDVYYLPREIIARDNILGEDKASKFDDAYMIEAYLEDVEGFGGSGDVFQKFGIEIRDECNFVVAKRIWDQTIGSIEGMKKPNEGDILYLPLSNSYFEITYVDTKKPFFQLSNLPTYTFSCALYEFNDEEIDTGVAEIDDAVKNWGYAQTFKITDASVTGTFEVGEKITQTISTGVTVHGILQDIDASFTGYSIFTLSNFGTSGTTNVKDFNTTAAITGASSGATATSIDTIYGINDSSPNDSYVLPNDSQADNVDFEIEGDSFLDFSETNPFGEPGS